MKLSNEQWSLLISGKVRTLETEDGYVTYRRFTEAQEAFIVERDYGRRPMASAGMFLELAGNVTRIAFDYRVELASSRRFFSFSVLEDGVKKAAEVKRAELMEDHFEYCPTKPCRLTIYLPNLHSTDFKNMEIEGTYEPVKRPRKLFIAGDSITQGYDAEEPHRAYANRLTEAMNAETLNQAIGGEKFNEGNLDDLPDFTPDIVVVNYGTNDWAHQYDIRNTSDAYFKRLAEAFPAAKLIDIEPIWRATEGTVKPDSGLAIADVRSIIRANAEKYGFTVIQGIDLVPHDPELFSDHSLHPNDAGFDYYADNLIRELQARAPEFFE